MAPKPKSRWCVRAHATVGVHCSVHACCGMPESPFSQSSWSILVQPCKGLFLKSGEFIELLCPKYGLDDAPIEVHLTITTEFTSGLGYRRTLWVTVGLCNIVRTLRTSCSEPSLKNSFELGSNGDQSTRSENRSRKMKDFIGRRETVRGPGTLENCESWSWPKDAVQITTLLHFHLKREPSPLLFVSSTALERTQDLRVLRSAVFGPVTSEDEPLLTLLRHTEQSACYEEQQGRSPQFCPWPSEVRILP